MGDTSSSSEEESYSPFFFKCYDCGTLITGSNRAYELSYQMVTNSHHRLIWNQSKSVLLHALYLVVKVIFHRCYYLSYS